jgi:hypothetical protein
VTRLAIRDLRVRFGGHEAVAVDELSLGAAEIVAWPGRAARASR